MHRVGLMSETIYRFKGMKGALKVIKDLGFQCADITIQKEGEACKMVSYFQGKNYIKKAHELKEYADKIKLPLVQAHATFPSIKDGNNRFNNTMWKKLLKCIEICGILKINHLIIHPFHDYDIKTNIDFYNRLLPFARKANVIICAENMYRWTNDRSKTRPCTSSFADTFNAIIDGVNSKYLKGCVDIGHAHMYKHMGYSPRKMIEEMNDRVVCLHIHDNDSIKDKHWIPFKGNVDFIDVAKGLKNIDYKGDLILEINGKEHINSYIEGLNYWKEAYQAIIKFKQMLLN